MKKNSVRLLWPQQQAEIAQWRCEYLLIQNGENNAVREAVLADVMPDIIAMQDENISLQLIVPAELVLFEQVALPARNQRQALQALPFVVEEQLADDIENTHLAVGRRQANGSWPVLAISSSWMQGLLDYLRELGVQPAAVYVDADMLSVKDEQLRIVMHAGRVLMRSASVAVATDMANAPVLMQLLEDSSSYKLVEIHLDDADEKQQLLAQQWITEFSALGEVKTTLEPLTTHLSGFLCAEMTGINLLQGRFFVKQKAVGAPWWLVGVAALLVVVIGQTVLQVSSGWYFNRKAMIAEKAAEDQYKKVFPSARQVSNPRKRFASRLAEAGSADIGSASFVSIFGSSIEALDSIGNAGEEAGITIQQLRYDGKRGELGLDLKAKTIEQMDRFKQALVQQGMQADIDSANEGADGVQGSIKIRAGA